MWELAGGIIGASYGHCESFGIDCSKGASMTKPVTSIRSGSIICRKQIPTRKP